MVGDGSRIEIADFMFMTCRSLGKSLHHQTWGNCIRSPRSWALVVHRNDQKEKASYIIFTDTNNRKASTFQRREQTNYGDFLPEISWYKWTIGDEKSFRVPMSQPWRFLYIRGFPWTTTNIHGSIWRHIWCMDKAWKSLGGVCDIHALYLWIVAMHIHG